MKPKPKPTPAKPIVPKDTQLDTALAACRSIRFAVKQAARHGGDFSLNDILAADRLAKEAIGNG